MAKRLLESARGGSGRAWAELAPLAEDARVGALDLESAAGVVALLGYALAGLTRLPFSVKCSTALGQLAAVQRAALDASEHERRLTALEGAVRPQRDPRGRL